MNKANQYNEIIKNNTISLDQVFDNRIGTFRWLSEMIYEGKYPLKINTVDYIIAKILNKKKNIYDLKRKEFFDVFVIGSFRTTFTPTLKVAESFADFYLEMKVLPNIIAVPKSIFIKNSMIYTNKIRNGVVLYERR